MIRLKASLDTRSIQQMIDRLEEEKKKVEVDFEKTMRKIVDYGVWLAKQNLDFYVDPSSSMHSGRMREGIVGEVKVLKTKIKGKIKSTAKYSQFIEHGFGQGYEGGTLEASNLTSQDYLGKIGASFGIEGYSQYSQRHGWVYYDEYLGEFFVSYGQDPKPFMYKTYKELKEKYDSGGSMPSSMYVSLRGQNG